MGKRLENWLSKASTPSTHRHWKNRWQLFAKWAGAQLGTDPENVDDVIRKDFEEMPNHLFQDKYRDLLTKYVASTARMKSNTALALVASVRAFFTSEAASIQIQKGRLPKAEMSSGEHRFTLPDLKAMWLIADFEGKARLSTALSLGWSIGDIITMETAYVKRILGYVDADGYVCFDYQRKKTKARVRGILNPQAVADLKTYLARVPDTQTRLWTTGTVVGFNKWIRATAKEAGVKANGQIRFHLLRKYVYDVAVSQIGPYEAKLLVGKTIPLEDDTYLHGLEDRLLERYKKFAYPLLRLNGESEHREFKIGDLEKKVEGMSKALDYLQSENVALKRRLDQNVAADNEIGPVIRKLLKNPKFRSLIEEAEKEGGDE